MPKPAVRSTRLAAVHALVVRRAETENSPAGLPHRLLPLRVGLEVLAALEAGFLIAVLPGWTPVRAAIAALLLIVGIAAAAAVVVLLGSPRRIRRSVAALLAAAILVGVAGPAAATGLHDPTQVGPADFDLSVSCSVVGVPNVIDGHRLDVRVAFGWKRQDLLTTGIGRGPWVDGLAAIPIAPDDAVQTASDPRVTSGRYEPAPSAWYPWGGASDSTSGGTQPDLLPYQRPWDDWQAPALNGGAAYSTAVSTSIGPGKTYAASWSMIPEEAGVPLPVIYAEFRHDSRFTVGTFASCADPGRAYPRLEAVLSNY